MTEANNNLVEKLISGDTEVWIQFLFNIDLAKKIVHIDKMVAPAILQAGVAWTGGGWTTGSANKKGMGNSQDTFSGAGF